jgi:hypothetical protein
MATTRLPKVDPGNVIIAAQNAADSGTYSGGSWQPALPLDNLKDRKISKTARSIDLALASTTFDIDLGKRKPVGIVAIIGHNLTPAAQWRVQLSDDAFATIKVDSGWMLAWPRVEEFGVLPWGVFNWGGLLALEVADLYTINSYWLEPAMALAQYIRVSIQNDSNPDGFVDIGRLYAGPIYQPTFNMQYGCKIGFEDPSTVQYSRGGQRYADQKPPRRLIQFTLARIPESEIFGQVFDQMYRRLGIVGDVVVVPQPLVPSQWHRQAIYGSMRTLNPLTMSFVDAWDTDFIVEENL